MKALGADCAMYRVVERDKRYALVPALNWLLAAAVKSAYHTYL